MSADRPPKPRFQFGLRWLFLAIAASALLLWGAGKLHQWYSSEPLAGPVASFNSRAEMDFIGRLEPKLTENEVAASIRSQLPTLKASREIKTIYDRIARTRRLPRGARIASTIAHSPETGERYMAWWINLDVVTGNGTHYTLNIRETNPAAAAQVAPNEASGDKVN